MDSRAQVRHGGEQVTTTPSTPIIEVVGDGDIPTDAAIAALARILLAAVEADFQESETAAPGECGGFDVISIPQRERKGTSG